MLSSEDGESGSIAGVSRPNVIHLLTVYLFLLMFIPSTLVIGPLGAAGTPATVAALALLVWFVISWLVGRISPTGYGRPTRIVMLAFTVAVLCGFVAAMTRGISQSESLAADRGLIVVVAWSGLVIVISQSVTRYDQLTLLMRRAVVFASVVAAIGIFEYYTKANVTSYIRLPGLTVNASYALALRGGLARPSSTASDSIEFGVVMAILLPFALQQALNSTQRGNVRKWLPVLLLVFGSFVSVSRSAVVALVAALIVIVPTLKPSHRNAFLLSTIPGLALLRAAAPGLVGTMLNLFGSATSGTSSSVASRTGAWSLDWPYVAQRPIFGRGFGTFLPKVYSWTDDMYLHALIEIGSVGLFCLIMIFFVGIHCGRVGRVRTKEEGRRAFGQAVVASMVVGAVCSGTFDSLSFPMFAGVLFFFLGVSGAYFGIMSAERDAMMALVGVSKARSVGR